MVGLKQMIKHQLAVLRVMRGTQYTLCTRYVHIRRIFRTVPCEECTIKTIRGVFRKTKIKLLFKSIGNVPSIDFLYDSNKKGFMNGNKYVLNVPVRPAQENGRG